MGWCQGSWLAEDIWNKVSKFIPDNKKQEVAVFFYEQFCNLDADDWDRSMSLMKYIPEEDEED